MKRISNWKTLTFASIVSLLVALQPAITFACTAGSAGHCGG